MSTGNSNNPTNIPDNSQLAYQQVPSQITHQMVVDPFSHIQTLTKPSEIKTWIRQLKSMRATLKWDDDYTLVMASNTCRGIFQRYVDEIIESGNTFTLDDLCEKLLRNVGARKTPRQCLQAIVEMKQKPEEAVFEFYMRLKTGKIDYCKAEGLDNSKSIDAFALVDSIVLQAFETGLRSELQEAVRLRQDDYDNLDEALEITQTIESVKSSLRSNSQMDQFEYLTAGVAEINISRTRTPHGQAGRAARGNNFSNQYNSYQQGPRQMTRHSNTRNTFFQSRNYQGPRGLHSQGPGRHYERDPRDSYNYSRPRSHFDQRGSSTPHFRGRLNSGLNYEENRYFVRSVPNRNGNYHGAFNSHRGSQFSGGRSDLALNSPSRNNYEGRFEGQRGRNSNRSQQQFGRGRGQMRGQNSYHGIPAPERIKCPFPGKSPGSWFYGGEL